MGAFADDLRSVPEMGAANLGEILAVSEWPGSTGAYAPMNVRVARDVLQAQDTHKDTARSVTPPPLPDREQLAMVPQDPDEEAVTLPRARAAAPIPSRAEHNVLEHSGHRLGHTDIMAIDEAQEAVLLSPGAELRSNAKLGLGLVVLASAVLGVLILQRSHVSLRSLSSLHDSAPAAGPGQALEQSAQAATTVPTPTVVTTGSTAPTAERPEVDSLPGPNEANLPEQTGVTVRQAQPLQPPGGDSEIRSRDNAEGAPWGPGNAASPGQNARAQGSAGPGHGRSGSSADPSRQAWMTRATRAEPGAGLGIEAFVEVVVRTVPRGASVAALGTDARCEPTPCALVVPKDRAVTLRAEARNTSVQKTFNFSEESEVELRLSNGRNKATAAAESPSGTVTKSAQVPHAPSDLKVPSIFR
jgi:hypothetical protein